MHKRSLLVLVVTALLLIIAPSVPVTAQSNLPLNSITLPEGFNIEVYASNVPNARSMVLGDNGTLFVGTRQAGNVYAITGSAGATQVYTIAQGLNSPNGVAFLNGSLYVAENTRILRFDNIEANLSNPQYSVIYDGFPEQNSHGWKFIRFGPDGKLYVPIGMPCNICDADLSFYGTIMRMNPDGSGLEVYASGIRNTVGFDWQPGTNVLWFTDNGVDTLGADRPGDELNQAAVAGLNFGFPYCHAGSIVDPQFGGGRTCAEFTPSMQVLGAHVAALGMRFYTGTMFPAEYQNQIFIAEHGGSSTDNLVGYRVTLVTLDSGGKAISYQPFAEGWLQGGNAWGRPVDLQVLPDGSLLLSDDRAGAIYRISYGQG
ncbi:MAG: PQQ-dependent sugar dehydrogenase [Anaerolineae bacterium]